MNIILASKSGVRKKILEEHKIECKVVHSNVDEDSVKESLIDAGANPLEISKNLGVIPALSSNKYAINVNFNYLKKIRKNNSKIKFKLGVSRF